MGKSLSDTQKAINKVHSGGLLRMGDMDIEDVPRIPTGILALDNILSGGLAKGTMVEMYGPPGSGKTGIAMNFMGQAQRHGHVALLDLEQSFSPHVAENSRINVDDLLLSQPDTAEAAFEIMEMMLDLDGLAAIVVDSVAGLTPKAELEGDYGDSHVGLVARLLSQACRKMGAELRKRDSDVIIVWINQLREKIGGFSAFGPQAESTGGRALKFWSATRLDVARIGPVKQGDEILGQQIKVKAIKHRSGRPYQQCVFDLLYETGMSNESTLLEMGLAAGLIEQGGAWFTFKSTGEKVQGKIAALEALREDDAMSSALMGDLGVL